MENNPGLEKVKAFRLLYSLTLEERKHLLRLIKSGVLGEKGHVLKSVQFILKHSKKERVSELRLSDWLHFLYGNVNATHSQYRQILFRLKNAVYDYWYHESFYAAKELKSGKVTEIRKGITVLKKLKEASLNNFFESEVKKIRQMFDKVPLDPDFLYLFSQLKQLEAEFKISHHPRKPRPELEDSELYLDAFYELEKEKLRAVQLSQSKMAGSTQSSPQAHETIFLTQARELTTFYRLYQQLERRFSHEGWLKLKAIFNFLAPQVSEVILEDAMALIISLIARRYNQGNLECRNILWTLYLDLLDKGILWKSQTNLSNHLINFAQLAAKLEKQEMAWEILKDNDEKINYLLPLGTLDLIKGTLVMSISDFPGAVRYFRQSANHSRDQSVKLICRTKIIICLFEQKKWDDVESALLALKEKANRMRESKVQISKSYFNFFSFTLNLKRIKVDWEIGMKNPGKLKKLISTVASCPELLHKNWLLSQLKSVMATEKAKGKPFGLP